MRRTSTIILMLLAIGSYGQSKAGGDWQKPPVLPILVSWGQDGLNIHAERTLAAASEIPFGLEVSGDLQKVGNDKIRINESDFKTPVFIELSPYFNGIDNLKHTDERMNAQPAMIKIDRTGRSRRNTTGEREFTLELRNFDGNKSQEFIVNGIDVFLIETKGSTKIEAYEKKIVIDVAESGIKEIMFRGGRLLKNNFVQEVPRLCLNYNEKYRENDAFTVEDTAMSSSSDWRLEHVRDLITKFNITDFRDETLAYLDELIITKNGIGFNVRSGTFKKNGGWVKYSKDHSYKFFKWAKFINLEFEKYYDHRQVKIRGPYNNNYLFGGTPHFSNVELIQFLKELNYIISSNVK